MFLLSIWTALARLTTAVSRSPSRARGRPPPVGAVRKVGCVSGTAGALLCCLLAASFVLLSIDRRHRRLKGSGPAQDGRTVGPPGLFHGGMRFANSLTISRARPRRPSAKRQFNLTACVRIASCTTARAKQRATSQHLQLAVASVPASNDTVSARNDLTRRLSHLSR